MGLNCSHKAWRGSYTAFMMWRRKIAKVAGLPPLQLMENFYEKDLNYPYRDTLGFGEKLSGADLWKKEQIEQSLPIKWDCLKPSPLHELLNHSDSDGEIAAERCDAIADELEKLIPLLPDEVEPGHIGHWREKTAKFVAGLRAAARANEPLLFG